MRICEALRNCRKSKQRKNHIVKTISTPYDFKHELAISYDYDHSRYQGFPEDDISWKFCNQHFGIPASNIPKIQTIHHDIKIPSILVMLKNLLFENKGHLTLHIFREPPNKKERDRVKEQLDLGKFNTCKDVHVIADLIKLWLRELPFPLLNDFNMNKMEKATEEKDEKLHKILIKTMKKLDRELLFWMADLMLEIAKYEHINQMGIEQLCIVMAPSFYCIKSQDPLEAVAQSKLTANFLKKILIFRGYYYKRN